MSINWDTPVNELMHSDDTIGMFESDEELMHFKYIKREKKNGKWVYYYDQSELDAKERAVEDARTVQLRAAARSGNAQVNARLATERGDKSAAASYRKDAETAHRSAKTAERYADKLEKQYKRKKIASFAARTISKGTVLALNTLSGKSKKKKTKKKKSRVTVTTSSSLAGYRR